jgi:hypothetical protein
MQHRSLLQGNAIIAGHADDPSSSATCDPRTGGHFIRKKTIPVATLSPFETYHGLITGKRRTITGSGFLQLPVFYARCSGGIFHFTLHLPKALP